MKVSGFYSICFLVLKKDGGLCPILILSRLNRILQIDKLLMLMLIVP